MKKYKEIWFVLMPSASVAGDPAAPKYMVAKELYSRKIIEKSQSDLNKYNPPFSTGSDSLIVTVNASETLGCFLKLKWYRPVNLIDIGVEARCLRNGLVEKDDCTLSSALYYYNIESEKVENSLDNIPTQLEYCIEYIQYMISLHAKIEDDIDYPRALLRGRYQFSVAVMERNGIPIDMDKYEEFGANRGAIRKQLIDDIDAKYGVFSNHEFNKALFSQYLHRNKMAWPKNDSGSLNCKIETFKEMAIIYPEISDLWHLKSLLPHLKENRLIIGNDGRNRSPLVPFKSKTSRNQPSSTKHIFGNSVCLRSFIRPAEGRAIAYIDWAQQEFGIAAALSKDQKMIDAYSACDPYLAFAIQVGSAPSMASKESHPEVRAIFKECILATQYGMGAKKLAKRIGISPSEASELLDYHKSNFAQFWQWSDQSLKQIMVNNKMQTKMGWNFFLNEKSEINDRSLRNFPMQANAAEIMRFACIMATEIGIKVCAPVHDALLIESPIYQIDDDVRLTQKLMRQAGEIILDGFQLKSDVQIFRYPERYSDDRGTKTWNKLNALIEKNSGNN